MRVTKERKTLMKPKYRLFSVLVGIIGSVVIHAHMVSAQGTSDIPASCLADARAQQQYQTGHGFGTSTVGQAWDTINQDCGQLERFESIVISSFESLILPPNASLAVQCRHAGILNGGIAALDDLWPICTDFCKEDGLQVGALVGQLYCDLSVALNGLEPADDFIRGPVMWCQFLGQTFCDVKYMSFTKTEYMDMSGQNSCLPYTDEPYIEVWDQFRNNGCAENPLPLQTAENPLLHQSKGKDEQDQ
jgi:hypothetical protein